jgi:ubiquinone/menaquinone biosynthesis C-methylase UbiE
VIDPLLRDAREHLPDFAGMKAGDGVLDVCCGSGAQVYAYLNKGLQAQGLDNDPGMLSQAQRYYAMSDAPPNLFTLADAAHLPFADGAFDFTSISLALHDKNSTLVNAIISEMKRVTRRGGALVFMDYSAPAPRNIIAGIIHAVEFFAGKEHFGNFKQYIRNGGLNPILENSGLDVVKTERVKDGNMTLALARGKR